jgi:uncharacterized protein YcbK (DUF882 family)
MDKGISNKQAGLQRMMSRREIIRLGLMSAAASIIPYNSMAAVRDIFSDNKRTLCLYNLHSKEYIQAVYWEDGKYVPDALDDINYMLRDHYCGAVRAIDKKLINLLFAIQQKLDTDEPYHIISGYRTAKTNAYLRRNNKRAAKRSLHIYGKAVDLRLPGSRLKEVRRAAYKLRAGGIGYYPKSDSLHLDVGGVRYWRGR